jgi:regulatory protein
MAHRESDGGGSDRLAPVIPLFTAPTAAEEPAPAGEQWHPTWTEPATGVAGRPSVAAAAPRSGSDVSAEATLLARDAAEKALLRKLRGRSLSVREARSVLSGHELDDADIDDVLDAFQDRGYLDDARLAEQLVHAATTRKAQGQRAIAQTLSARGIPRDLIDATLAELPDDDAERALEFARTKARSLASLDHDTALRRLHGQLARRGFTGPAAMSAARQALEEAGCGRSSVRFR